MILTTEIIYVYIYFNHLKYANTHKLRFIFVVNVCDLLIEHLAIYVNEKKKHRHVEVVVGF